MCSFALGLQYNSFSLYLNKTLPDLIPLVGYFQILDIAQHFHFSLFCILTELQCFVVIMKTAQWHRGPTATVFVVLQTWIVAEQMMSKEKVSRSCPLSPTTMVTQPKQKCFKTSRTPCCLQNCLSRVWRLTSIWSSEIKVKTKSLGHFNFKRKQISRNNNCLFSFILNSTYGVPNHIWITVHVHNGRIY